MHTCGKSINNIHIIFAFLIQNNAVRQPFSDSEDDHNFTAVQLNQNQSLGEDPAYLYFSQDLSGAPEETTADSHSDSSGMVSPVNEVVSATLSSSTPMLPMASSTPLAVRNQFTQGWCGYKIIGDNLDKCVKPRYVAILMHAYSKYRYLYTCANHALAYNNVLITITTQILA